MTPSFLSRCVVYAVFVIAIATNVSGQESTAESIAQIEKAMREEIAQKPTDETSRAAGVDSRGSREMMLYQLRSLISRGDANFAEESLRQVLLSFESQAVRVGVEKLRAAMTAEREAREKAFASQAEAAIAAAAKAAQDARNPADLDTALRELTLTPERREANLEKLMERLRNARQFLVYWQDYLAHAAAGRPEAAAQSLQSASNMSGTELLPRSEILARLEPFKEKKDQGPPAIDRLREIMQKTKTLDDLPAALAATAEMRRQSKTGDKWDDPTVMLHEELLRIRRCYEDFRAGVPTLLQVRSDQRPMQTEPVELAFPLKLQLLRLVIPRFLGVDEKPAPDEQLDNYVDRMMQLAFDRCDPRLIQKVYTVRNTINGVSHPPQLSPGLDALLAARNQEDAGQFLPAVISYQRALRIGGELVPTKQVGARLAAIQAAHPAEYEAGLKKFLERPDPQPPAMVGSQPPFTLRVPAPSATPR